MTEGTAEEKRKLLIEASLDVKSKAYCPYSNFRVGAALLCNDGQIITGVNVENASYGLSICAERSAVFRAVSMGLGQFVAIAVSSDMTKEFITPCGACRQVLAEFNVNMELYLVKPDGSYQTIKLSELLPLSFTKDTLQQHSASISVPSSNRQ